MICIATEHNVCNRMQCNAIECNAMQCNAIECNAVQCNAIKCNAWNSLGSVKDVVLDCRPFLHVLLHQLLLHLQLTHLHCIQIIIISYMCHRLHAWDIRGCQRADFRAMTRLLFHNLVVLCICIVHIISCVSQTRLLLHAWQVQMSHRVINFPSLL